MKFNVQDFLNWCDRNFHAANLRNINGLAKGISKLKNLRALSIDVGGAEKLSNITSHLSQLCRCATEASINQNHFRVANCCYLISGRDPCHPVSRLREDFSWVESELNPKTAKTARHREYGSQASGHACRELSAALDESTSWTEAALAHPRTS